MKNIWIYMLIISQLFVSCMFFGPKSISEDFIIRDYIPFKDGTKAVKLLEPSTLKLEDNLPRIDGATALYPLYAAFVQAVYPDIPGNYDPYSDPYEESLVIRSTTTVAYDYLIHRRVDIIFCAKPSVKQIEEARENGVEFIMTPIGKEAFVFFVNKKNPVSNISTNDIIKIYSGEITNWRKLGGRNADIKAYQRPENSGSQTMLESIMGDVAIIDPIKETVLTFMLDIVTHTAGYQNYRNALGYSFLFYTTEMIQNDRIKLLAINNIFPSRETIQDGTYPYTDEFYAIITDTKNENVQTFINWILSEQGQFLVEKTGYIPIR